MLFINNIILEKIMSKVQYYHNISLDTFAGYIFDTFVPYFLLMHQIYESKLLTNQVDKKCNETLAHCDFLKH